MVSLEGVRERDPKNKSMAWNEEKSVDRNELWFMSPVNAFVFANKQFRINKCVFCGQ